MNDESTRPVEDQPVEPVAPAADADAQPMPEWERDLLDGAPAPEPGPELVDGTADPDGPETPDPTGPADDAEPSPAADPDLLDEAERRVNESALASTLRPVPTIGAHPERGPDGLARRAAAEAADAVGQEVRARVEQEQAQGFRGTEVDPTPNENYSVAGVTSGAPVPETSQDAALEALRGRRDVEQQATGVAGV